jgi:hypothetical protein
VYSLGLPLYCLLGELQGLDHDRLGYLVRPRLDHGDCLPGASNHEVEVALGDLVVGRVKDKLAIERTPDAHGPDRTVERKIRKRERRGSAYHTDGVKRCVLVGDEYGPNDLYLVVIVLRKQGPQGPVSKPRGQDRTLRRPSFALDKAARDLAGGGHALLDVHAQGQKSRSWARCLRAGRRG